MSIRIKLESLAAIEIDHLNKVVTRPEQLPMCLRPVAHPEASFAYKRWYPEGLKWRAATPRGFVWIVFVRASNVSFLLIFTNFGSGPENQKKDAD